MTVSYSCPGCNYSDRLSNYVCFNCRKNSTLRFSGADKHVPFVCTNCDVDHFALYCPKCGTAIGLRFVKIAKEEIPWTLVFIGVIVLSAIFGSDDKNKKQSEDIPAVEAPKFKQSQISETSTSLSSANYSPSFDCSRVTSDQENLICGDSELAELDVNLNTAYSKAKNESENESLLVTEQRDWINTVRNACSDKECLKESMVRRIEELSN